MPKRVVISGYLGFKNFGDEAILSVLVSKLQEYKHRITVISSNPEYTKSKYTHIRSVKMFELFDIIGVIAKSDILISGGGSLLQDVTSTKSLFYYLFIIVIALILNKKVIVFAQGIGPINSILGKFITPYILKKCTYVSVRDEKSFELLKSWGINSDLLCDPVFSTKLENLPKNNKVAIQLRNFKNMTEDFIDRLAMEVCKEFPDKEIDIYSFQDSIDLEVCKKFQRSLNLLNPEIKTTIHSEVTDAEVIEGISTSEYLIAMRFHAIIIALLAGVKTMGINYDIKVEKIASEFNLPLINFNNVLNDKFKLLKSQNVDQIQMIVKRKVFNWDNFEKVISDENN